MTKQIIRKNFCMPIKLDLEIKDYEHRTGVKLNISKICRKAIRKILETDAFQITTA